MNILSPKYPGIWFICEQCRALIGNVKESEIYNNSDVYCPICKFKNTLPFNKNYDGIVKEQEIKEKNE